MRSNLTSHLSGDLAQLHDATQARRAEVAWDRLTLDADAPERPALDAEAQRLDTVLETLRDPEATQTELAWARNWGAEAEIAEAEAETGL